MIELTDQMREELAGALENGHPATVATTSRAGMPDIAFKGSLMVWDSEHLFWWERSHGQTLANLQENPRIAVLYLNMAARAMWKFSGEADLLTSGPLREQIMARAHPLELKNDPDRKGVAVLIRVDRVMQAGNVLMER